jgi:hypothetical protein
MTPDVLWTFNTNHILFWAIWIQLISTQNLVTYITTLNNSALQVTVVTKFWSGLYYSDVIRLALDSRHLPGV